MISVNNLSIAFGGESLFDHISFILNDKDRIGLVGKNGSGKSTMLKLISGIQQPDEGEVIIPDGYTIGYLPQEKETNSARSVIAEASLAFEEVESLKRLIDIMDHELKSRTDFTSRSYQQLLRKHHDTWERFLLIGGQSVQADMEKVLAGLGFLREDFNRPLKEFSSGWQMRVEIARILLQQPDLILLDEPTNHLDIESIQWLEEFLINYRGAVVIVSHDRAFLDNITKRTIEITQGRIFDYKANYSGYIEMREERMESQLATYTNQMRQVRQIERFIERFRYKNTKSRQVQSRIRMLEKMEIQEIDEMDESGIHFTFPPAPHSGKIIFEAHGLEKSYPRKIVFHNLDFQVIKGDRIAFVGKNGEGKTTLARILNGKLDFTGTLKKGHHVIPGFYAQELSESLDPEKTVFKTIDDIAMGDIRPKIRTILGSFLFSGDDIDKKVKVLSGGEKSRLSLAKLLLTPANLLILDEPTNHLDMHSKDILKNALLQFNGTLILVSHDRDFLQGLTNRVFEFRGGGIREYIGDIYDFLEQRKVSNLAELEKSGGKEDHPVKENRDTENKISWEKRKESEREQRKLINQIRRSEEIISGLEKEIKQKEQVLQHPEQYTGQMPGKDWYREYEELQRNLKEEMERWEFLNRQLEVMNSGKEAG
jgi:ATP-binding cassette subfamily F protein 3